MDLNTQNMKTFLLACLSLNYIKEYFLCILSEIELR